MRKLGALFLLAAAAAQAQTPPASGTLVCTGALTRSPNMDWGKSTIEFVLPYSAGLIVPLKSDVEALNAPLRIEMDDAALKAVEHPGRMASPEGNMLRITQLQVSRQTGRFSLEAVMSRESSGATIGSALWEGSCAPAKEEAKKF